MEAFIILFICLVIIFTLFFTLLQKHYQKEAQKLEEKQELDRFYEECQRFGIEDWQNPGSEEKKQRVALIAKKHKCNLSDPMFLEQFNALHQQKQREKETAKIKADEDTRQKEQEQYAKLTHYAKFHGTDKPVTMLRDLAKEAVGGSVPYIPTQKESDGAIMAGIASGIGGTVPALMSLSNTARSNEEVRQQNQAANAVNMLIYQGQVGARERASKYREKADDLAVKLISDMPKEEVFQYLKFTEVQTSVSSVGSITVEAEAAVNGTVTVFDKPGVVDGFVVAEIFSGKQKVGEAIMVFPVFGSDSYKFRVNEAEDRYFARRRTSRDPHYRKETVKIRGICLNCGEQGKNYTVKFVPGDLWIMEQ